MLKNRAITYIIYSLIGLAVIGILSKLFYDTAGFFKGIAIMLVIGAVIFFVMQRLNSPGQDKREQRAFVKAAKRSAKRKQQKEVASHNRKKKTGSGKLTSIKKERIKRKHAPELTVIEGKKGKKKNRASFL